MLISAWHLLLPIFLCSPKVYCDDATASVQLFLDQECSQAESGAFKAQLNICIVISGAAAVGAIDEGHNPCDSGFIFITGYFDPFCMNGVTIPGPNNTIPDRCYSGGGSSGFAAIQVYCIAQESPLLTTTLSAISKTPSSITISYVSEFSSHTTTTEPALPNTIYSSKTTPSTISGTPSSSTATALTASGTPSFLTTTAQTLSEAQSPPAKNAPTVSGSPSPFPTTTTGGSGSSNTSSGLRDHGKVVVGVSIGVSATALIVGFLAWLFPNPCNQGQHSSVVENQPRQHRWHGSPQPRSRRQ